MTAARTRHLVLYDSDCPLCTFQMRMITWMDWFKTVALVPIKDAPLDEIRPRLEHESLLEALHCVSRGGKVYRGARCLRFIGMRMPLAVPVALFLWLPGVIWVAEIIYRWVSHNRQVLSRLFGCKEACRYLPERKEHKPDATLPGAH